MDVTQALRDTENTLRDFIAETLERTLGDKWLDKCGVTPERIAKWRDRKNEEERRQEAGVVDERLLYYADFYDLKTILKKHWSGDFSKALGDWKRFETFFEELACYRDPDSHRRELLPHQQSLILGITGDIRSRLIRFHSRLENLEDCFPRIESARDSLGNLWLPSLSLSDGYPIFATLHPGDEIDIIVTARDPEDLPIEYALNVIGRNEMEWQKSGVFSIKIEETYISEALFIELTIRSPRSYHARLNYDDKAVFCYRVFPNRN